MIMARTGLYKLFKGRGRPFTCLFTHQHRYALHVGSLVPWGVASAVVFPVAVIVNLLARWLLGTPWWAVLAWMPLMAIVVGFWVRKDGFTYKDDVHIDFFKDPIAQPSALLLAHEFYHTTQWSAWGVVGFLRRYVTHGSFVEDEAWTFAGQNYRDFGDDRAVVEAQWIKWGWGAAA